MPALLSHLRLAVLVLAPALAFAQPAAPLTDHYISAKKHDR
jgi:hypothetical protein